MLKWLDLEDPRGENGMIFVEKETERSTKVYEMVIGITINAKNRTGNTDRIGPERRGEAKQVPRSRNKYSHLRSAQILPCHLPLHSPSPSSYQNRLPSSWAVRQTIRHILWYIINVVCYA